MPMTTRQNAWLAGISHNLGITVMQLLPSMLADPLCAFGAKPSVADVTAPIITSGNAFNHAENGLWSLTLTANEFVTWSKVGGVDQALFTLVGDTLSLAAKDFETPIDVGANNTYVVQIRATDGSNNFTDQTITVTITNVDEGGEYVPALKFNDARNSMYIGAVV